jgi:hypothetical protein
MAVNRLVGEVGRDGTGCQQHAVRVNGRQKQNIRVGGWFGSYLLEVKATDVEKVLFCFTCAV